MADLELRRPARAGTMRLRLEGELDLASAPALERNLRGIAACQPGRILLDLGDLEFMDCTGLSVLLRAQHAAEANGHRLALVRVPGQVRRLFTLTGVGDRFTVES